MLETLVLSVLNHDTAIASAAARMVTAAARAADHRDGRPPHPRAGRGRHRPRRLPRRVRRRPATSPPAGATASRPSAPPRTRSRSRTRARRRRSAARSRRRAPAPRCSSTPTTSREGIRTAVAGRRARPSARVRIDSGDLADEAAEARALLDELGATDTRIVVTSDLDEFVITALADAPIDGYGVGTRVATGSGHPTASMVYKLVAVATSAGRTAPRRSSKKSKDKVSVGGHKTAWRSTTTPACSSARASRSPGDRRARAARRIARADPGDARRRHGPRARHSTRSARSTAAALRQLPPEALSVAAGAPYLTVTAHRGGDSMTTVARPRP